MPERHHGNGRCPLSTGSTPRGDDDADGWDDVTLDEDFIRDAEVAEPAARTRMLTARWRRGGPEPQPWRADEPPADGSGASAASGADGADLASPLSGRNCARKDTAAYPMGGCGPTH
ncbi:hypothetical protein GCM10017744_008010 [Streptomyces antimycoticus]